MKKSIEISVHLFFWIVFAAFAFMLSKIYLQAKPDAQFGNHLLYVISLEVVMGLIFFYTTFFGIPWARKSISRYLILSAVLLFLLLFFAYPAMSFGMWEVLSSIIPHVIVIFLAIIFRRFSDSIRLEQEKQALLLQNNPKRTGFAEDAGESAFPFQYAEQHRLPGDFRHRKSFGIDCQAGRQFCGT